MHQLLYCMRFKGRATAQSEQPSTLVVDTAGDSCTITTAIDQAGMRCALQPITGGHAYFHSRAVMTGPDAFREEGFISFGDEIHTLRFASVGDGHLAAERPGSALRNGAVTWRVEGGEGQFAGARGLITSNFTVNGEDVTDYQIGVISLPDAPGS